MSINTPFGPLVKQEEDTIIGYLLQDNNGYVTGPSFFNQIGLSSWVPADTHIATNRTSDKAAEHHIVIHAPVTVITTQNKRYLQILDCIRDLGEYPVDAADPDKLIRQFIDKHGLEVVQFLKLARHYGHHAERWYFG